ncbi:MAG TPA: response regulator [Thermoanaerobaculia bacterium]|nr:response regulator [Thermoanaerobaculia bacterium]
MPTETILVVDDDHSIRRLIRTLLSRAGFETEEAQNGDEALRMLQEQPYRIILLDLMMPVVNGFEVLEWIEEHAPETLQCVIVTTAAADRDISRLRRDAVFSVLRKPFDLAELVETVSRCAARTEGTPGDAVSR